MPGTLFLNTYSVFLLTLVIRKLWKGSPDFQWRLQEAFIISPIYNLCLLLRKDGNDWQLTLSVSLGEGIIVFWPPREHAEKGTLVCYTWALYTYDFLLKRHLSKVHDKLWLQDCYRGKVGFHRSASFFPSLKKEASMRLIEYSFVSLGSSSFLSLSSHNSLSNCSENSSIYFEATPFYSV